MEENKDEAITSGRSRGDDDDNFLTDEDFEIHHLKSTTKTKNFQFKNI